MGYKIAIFTKRSRRGKALDELQARMSLEEFCDKIVEIGVVGTYYDDTEPGENGEWAAGIDTNGGWTVGFDTNRAIALFGFAPSARAYGSWLYSELRNSENPKKFFEQELKKLSRVFKETKGVEEFYQIASERRGVSFHTFLGEDPLQRLLLFFHMEKEKEEYKAQIKRAKKTLGLETEGK